MPCLDISTNVNLDGVDKDSLFSEITRVVAEITGKPESYVMVLLKGSVDISFGGNKEAAAFAEIVAMGGIDREIKRKIIAAVGDVLQDRLGIPVTRFVLKVHDTTLGRNTSKL